VITEQRLRFKTVGTIVITADMSIHMRSKTFENLTSDLETMKRTVRELLGKFLEENELGARRVGVKISNLVREQKSQKELTSFIQPDKA
jgi:nucleotidyltransferase/DNA polymerase involved in DNA repair